jgi:hypothetical protein
MIHNNGWVYAIGVPFFLFAYSSIVAAEEAFLRAKFGAEYERYTRRVNRWVPNFRGLRESLKDMRFAWRRVVLKEYGSTYAWTASALALMAYDTLTYFHYEQRRLYLNGLALLLVLVTIGWGVARYLKKSRRLIAD